MAYRDFSLEEVLDVFDLQEDRQMLFENTAPLKASDWLQEGLRIGLTWGLTAGTEKARSECIVMPILMELDRQHPNLFTLYSGKSLNVDPAQGLMGECDFIIAKSKPLKTIHAPIFTLVEAKKQDMDLGLGQCAAQVVGAHRFNQLKQSEIEAIYGCVTTGEVWQFLKLENRSLIIDSNRYTLKELEILLGVFHQIFEFYR